jgi:hypothetical protein
VRIDPHLRLDDGEELSLPALPLLDVPGAHGRATQDEAHALDQLVRLACRQHREETRTQGIPGRDTGRLALNRIYQHGGERLLVTADEVLPCAEDDFLLGDACGVQKRRQAR